MTVGLTKTGKSPLLFWKLFQTEWRLKKSVDLEKER